MKLGTFQLKKKKKKRYGMKNIYDNIFKYIK